jgi:hypothetical protein
LGHGGLRKSHNGLNVFRLNVNIKLSIDVGQEEGSKRHEAFAHSLGLSVFSIGIFIFHSSLHDAFGQTEKRLVETIPQVELNLFGHSLLEVGRDGLSIFGEEFSEVESSHHGQVHILVSSLLEELSTSVHLT